MKIFCSAKTEPNTAVNSDRAEARRVTLCVMPHGLGYRRSGVANGVTLNW